MTNRKATGVFVRALIDALFHDSREGRPRHGMKAWRSVVMAATEERLERIAQEMARALAAHGMDKEACLGELRRLRRHSGTKGRAPG